MLPNLATRHSAATWEAQRADAATRQLTADRRLFFCLIAGAAYLFLLAGTLAAKWHWLPKQVPVEVAAAHPLFV